MCTDMEYWLSLSAVALDLVLALACQAYTECIFRICDYLTADKRKRTQAALERSVSEVKHRVSIETAVTVISQTDTDLVC